MRVLVCGGRDYHDRQQVFDVLDDLREPATHIIHGGARGADTFGRDWAKERKVPYTTFRADWGKLGRAAGPIRNQKMLSEGKPDLVVAFPGGKGTADMVSRAKKAGIPVIEIT